MAGYEAAAHHTVASCRKKEPRGSGGRVLEQGRKLEVEVL